MRIKMLETVNTVGQILEYDKVYEIDTPLADALIARGQAEDPFVAKAPKPAAPTFEFRPAEAAEPVAQAMMDAVRPMVSPVESALTGTPEPALKPKPAKKPAKKAAAK